MDQDNCASKITLKLSHVFLTTAEMDIWTFLVNETNRLHGGAELLPVVELRASAHWQALVSGLKNEKRTS